MEDRIAKHLIGRFQRGKQVILERKSMKAYANKTVAAFLYANGLRNFSWSMKYHQPRGFSCAIERSSCMAVNGISNIRTSMANVRGDMKVPRQKAPPGADHDVKLLENADPVGIGSGLAGITAPRLLGVLFTGTFLYL